MSIDSAFAINFSPITGITFLFIFLFLNSRLDKKLKRLFVILLIMELAELVVYNAELVFAARSSFSGWRILLSAIGYSIRPVLVYMILQLALRRPMTKISRMLIALPMELNIIAAFSAFWTDIVYSYTAANQFVRGPLGYCSQLCIIFYVAVFVAGITSQLSKRERVESIIMLAILCLLAGSMVIEAVWNIRSIGRTAIVLSTVFYYMFFQTCKYQETLATEERIHEQLMLQASTDQFTGLLNKAAFIERLTQALEQALVQPEERSIALIFLDLDHFKSLNDTLGHQMGDKALQEVGVTLRGVFRSEDSIGRFGGDEFCVLLRVASEEQLEQKLCELRQSLQKTYARGRHTVRLTASIGAAIAAPDLQTDATRLMETVDAAVYAVKKSGGDGYKIVTLE